MRHLSICSLVYNEITEIEPSLRLLT